MGKQAVNKKSKNLKAASSVSIHDIISKIKSSHDQMDKKLEELAQMCAPKELRIK